jgi:hypothetical protein
MLVIAKTALGLGAALALATAYTLREGVIRVDVDENRAGGSHVHFWVPATTVSAGLYLAPQHHIQRVAELARPFLPLLREISKELPKYPNAVFVDVSCDSNHLRVAMADGKLQVDAKESDQIVHLNIPPETLRDVADRLEDAAPVI